LHSAQEALAQAEQDRDYLLHAAAEITALAPEPDEETLLADQRAAMLKGQKIAEDLNDALAGLTGADGALAQLRQSARRLERVGGDVPELARAVAELDLAIDHAAAAEDQVERWRRAAAFDPATLERTEQRLFDLRGLARKHKVPVADLAAYAHDLQTRLDALMMGSERISSLNAASNQAEANFRAACETLSQKRQAGARKLDKAVAQELSPLKLDKAKFRTKIDLLPAENWSAAGADRVEFEIATNPGAPFGPLTRIASGGELSRFILALKVALAATGSAGTLIFDEIDRGVGGAVAAAIGERLARLADHVQVLLVTHSPQVAASALHHCRISKASGRTHVDPLTPLARQEEIARMLSGDQITNEARAQAARLLSAV
jgi:DNA repair protein RecN (Recombination protein N)